MKRNSVHIHCKHCHDDVIKWKHFPRYFPFVRGIHKGQWRGALMFSLICVWINGWVNNSEAGDLRRYRAHYDLTVMAWISSMITVKPLLLLQKLQDYDIGCHVGTKLVGVYGYHDDLTLSTFSFSAGITKTCWYTIKPSCFSSRPAVVFAQSIEGKC